MQQLTFPKTLTLDKNWLKHWRHQNIVLNINLSSVKLEFSEHNASNLEAWLVTDEALTQSDLQIYELTTVAWINSFPFARLCLNVVYS